MHRFIVTVDSAAQSGDLTKQEIIQAIKAATGKNPHAATIVRDSEGKIIQVIVNLPYDVAANDLATATAAINDNSGVAGSTIVEPLSLTNGVESFEDEVDGVVVDKWGSTDIDKGVELSYPTYPAYVFNVASNVEASEGSLSMAFLNTTDYSKTLREWWQPADPSLQYSGLHAKYKIFFESPRDVTGGSPGAPLADPKNNARLGVSTTFGYGKAYFAMNGGSPKDTGASHGDAGKLSVAVAGGAGGGAAFPTGGIFDNDLPFDTWLEVELDYDVDTGLLELYVRWGEEELFMKMKKNTAKGVLRPITNRLGDEFLFDFGLESVDPAKDLEAKVHIDELEVELTKLINV